MGFAKTAIIAINTITALLGAAMMGIGCYAYLGDKIPIGTPGYARPPSFCANAVMRKQVPASARPN